MAEVEEISNKYTDDVAGDVQAAFKEVTEAQPEPVVTETKASPEPEKTETAEAKADRERDELGRFAPKKAEEPVKADKTAEPAKVVDPAKVDPKAAPVTQVQPTAQPTISGGPPTSWSIKAKSQWDSLAPDLKEAIAKRETEVSTGFKEYEGLKPFVQRARQSGQSLPQVLQAYVGIDDLLRQDQGRGFSQIAQNIGLTQHQAGALFAQLAQAHGFQLAPGNQNAQVGQQPSNAAADPTSLPELLRPVLTPYEQRLQQLEQRLQQQAEADNRQRLAQSGSVIEQFRQDPAHRYYDDLEGTIANLLNAGVVPRTGNSAADLKAAYDAAARMHPEIGEILLKERVAKDAEATAAAAKLAADKAKAASRSVSGSPSPGAQVQTPRSNAGGKRAYDEDLYDDVRRGVQAVGASA